MHENPGWIHINVHTWRICCTNLPGGYMYSYFEVWCKTFPENRSIKEYTQKKQADKSTPVTGDLLRT